MRALSITLWFALAAVLAVSTFFTATPVYGSWWLIALWILVSLLLLVAILSRRMAATPAARLLHLGLLIIIVGGLLTRFTASRGILFLEPGHTVDRYLDTSGRGRDIGARVTLDSIKPLSSNAISTAPGYFSYLTVGGSLQIVSPNNPLTVGRIQLSQASVSPSGATVFSVYSGFWGRNLVYLGYLLTVTGFFYLICKKRLFLPQLIGFLLIVLFFALISPHPPFNPLEIFGQSPESQPLLQSRWLIVHVSLIIASYLLLALVSLLSLIRPGSLTIPLRLLPIAIFLLSTGIAAGSLWAAQAWGRYWAWDPKETWALVTLMVYAAPLHPSFTAVYRGQRLSVYLIFAFLTVLMTYFGVNYLPSLHAYR